MARHILNHSFVSFGFTVHALHRTEVQFKNLTVIHYYNENPIWHLLN